MPPTPPELDFLLIGAGISGIGVACHLARGCPDKRFVILEQRERLGGTWDLFRYPGIRCDSDMCSFGYAFHPWPSDAIITGGESIREYLRETAEAYGVDRAIRYGHHVTRASWSSERARWTVRAEVDGPDGRTEHIFRARFLVMCPGYFSYERGFKPDIAGLDDFAGEVLHPQFWPEGFDYAGKRVVVIAKGGADVTMLQRSPTYYLSLPDVDRTVALARKVLPSDLVTRTALVRNTLTQLALYKACRRFPRAARAVLLAQVRKRLGGKVDMRHFTPRYDPWDERLCVVPNGDLFEVLRDGRATIVTDEIERVAPDGVLLRSGERLDADVLVTATGLDVRLFGGVHVEVDGEAVDPSERPLYKAAMIDGVPNFATIFGYANSSWTRKVDAVGPYLCRLARHMDRTGAEVAVPEGGARFISDDPFFPLKSGYAKRATALLPKQGERLPWRTTNNAALDYLMLRLGSLRDGHLAFRPARAPRPQPARDQLAA